MNPTMWVWDQKLIPYVSDQVNLQCQFKKHIKLQPLAICMRKKPLVLLMTKIDFKKKKFKHGPRNPPKKKADQKPMYDTKPVTRQAFQKLESTFKAMINSPAATMKLTQETGSKNVEFIPLIAASSNAASNQTVKKAH